MFHMPLRLHVTQNVSANNLSMKDITVYAKYKCVGYKYLAMLKVAYIFLAIKCSIPNYHVSDKLSDR
jgi:hypothetical protein